MGHKQSKDEKRAGAQRETRQRTPPPPGGVPAAMPTGTAPHRRRGHSERFPNGDLRGPCRYFLAGDCREGSNCRYQHSQTGADPMGGAGSLLSPTSPSPHSSGTPHTPQRSPHKHTIRTEEQALLLAMLQSLKDSLAAASTPAERSAIYRDMKKAAEQYKQEQHRIREERARMRAASFSSPSSTNNSMAERPSPLRNVQFPTFPYDSARFGQQQDEGSEDRQECSICLDSYTDGQEILVLPCLHWFHSTCVQQWMEKHTECPLCQLDIVSALRSSP
ncbi:zinc finger protein, putative [Bodo saltans]|uniref:RING-type E3 ubiquitin transferase n=1 Tax=Bodo saltans TaxID=75058 RepID=A0A0S4J5B0_BODSA|nr:zinc finger protein, putative [Bodo saltans]|eukprot:CUG82714.1 zinc finger protein, putative [Bodo saltans]